MKGIAAYSRTRVESAPNDQLLVMLLEKAMEKETLAMVAIAAGDRVTWNAALHHTRAIFIELLAALDGEPAPALAQAVSTTYRWSIHQLTVAARTGDATLVERVREATATLHSAWSAAVATGQEAA